MFQEISNNSSNGEALDHRSNEHLYILIFILSSSGARGCELRGGKPFRRRCKCFMYTYRKGWLNVKSFLSEWKPHTHTRTQTHNVRLMCSSITLLDICVMQKRTRARENTFIFFKIQKIRERTEFFAKKKREKKKKKKKKLASIIELLDDGVKGKEKKKENGQI